MEFWVPHIPHVILLGKFFERMVRNLDDKVVTLDNQG